MTSRSAAVGGLVAGGMLAVWRAQKKPVAAEEWRLREELACAHWITNHYGMDDLVWNHISCRVGDKTLITPGGVLFDEVTPENLVMDSSNVTANVIHDAVYAARPDVSAVVHLHTEASVAVSCLERGFMCLDQNSAQFYGDMVACHEYEGLSTELSEQAQIARDLGEKACVLLMRNHGFCTCGSTIGEAWVRAWYFEKCCRLQLDCLQTGAAIHMPPTTAMEKAKPLYNDIFKAGRYEWPAIMRKWRKATGS